MFVFDISWVDQATQLYYLADRSNAVIDVVDTKTDTFVKQIAGGFKGFTGNNDTSGPNGVVVIGFVTEFQRAYWQDRLRAELEQALSERLSVAVRVRCVVQTVKADAPAASDDPMHRAALEIFRRPDRIMEID